MTILPEHYDDGHEVGDRGVARWPGRELHHLPARHGSPFRAICRPSPPCPTQPLFFLPTPVKKLAATRQQGGLEGFPGCSRNTWQPFEEDRFSPLTDGPNRFGFTDSRCRSHSDLHDTKHW
ncbi:hypothetical protein E2C01_070342 [Portunus trituberculatus]|uniref:Uncharacterized protein n=1 Tax=Portunus trituberculatus TaxID=210409 RepID=A0A5B7HX12_PORTR|nr:hypothetical protein [Portunus trituberculatus]